MKSIEPTWFAKLSPRALEKARQWLHADPDAFAEIVAMDKRGRPKAANGPDLAFENMAKLLTDNPRQRLFTAARLSAQLVQDKTVAPRSQAIRLMRQWAQVSHRYLKAEQHRRKKKDPSPAYLSSWYGYLTAEAASSMLYPSIQEIIAEFEKNGSVVAKAEKELAAGRHGSLLSNRADAGRAYGLEAYLLWKAEFESPERKAALERATAKPVAAPGSPQGTEHEE
jgi:hypothetical protein